MSVSYLSLVVVAVAPVMTFFRPVSSDCLHSGFDINAFGQLDVF